MKYAKLESAAYRRGRKLAAKRGLVYEKIEQSLVLYLVDTGTHDDIFRR